MNIAIEEKHYAFGRNWRRFLQSLNEERISSAEQSLISFFGKGAVTGKSFLDIGSGSGLFSLAAKRLGAHVRSFDYDADSVGCALYLRNKYNINLSEWPIEQGSILDEKYVNQLGKYDIVYSWGVLHHAGDMWSAIRNAASLVAPNGTLLISIYNDQGGQSRRWKTIKYLWSHHPITKPIIFLGYFPVFLKDLAINTILGTKRVRGMSPWWDLFDWLGGYPFEVARPEAIFSFVKALGFKLEVMTTCGGGLGCNQFVFVKS